MSHKDAITGKAYLEVIRAAIREALALEERCYRSETHFYPGCERGSLIAASLKSLHASNAIGHEIDAMVERGDLVVDEGMIRLVPDLSPRERIKRSLMECIGPDARDIDSDTSISYLLKVYSEPSDVLSILGEMMASGEIAIMHYKGEAFVRRVAKVGA